MEEPTSDSEDIPDSVPLGARLKETFAKTNVLLTPAAGAGAGKIGALKDPKSTWWTAAIDEDLGTGSGSLSNSSLKSTTKNSSIKKQKSEDKLAASTVTAVQVVNMGMRGEPVVRSLSDIDGDQVDET